MLATASTTSGALKPAKGGRQFSTISVRGISARTICSDATKLGKSVAKPRKTEVCDNHLVRLGVVKDVARVKIPMCDAVLVDKGECL